MSEIVYCSTCNCPTADNAGINGPFCACPKNQTSNEKEMGYGRILTVLNRIVEGSCLGFQGSWQDFEYKATQGILELRNSLRDTRAQLAERDREVGRLKEVLKTQRETCRYWLERSASYCHKTADFILWGKLADPDDLGPRCSKHISKEIRQSGSDQYAVVDLRSVNQALKGET